MNYSLKKRYKILACSKDFNLYCKGRRLYAESINTGKLLFIGKICLSKKHNFLSVFRLTQRCFRLEPRCAIFIDEENALVSMHGAVYNVSISKKTVVLEHKFREGMNNPLSFCKIDNIAAFDNVICYGEYFGNKKGDEVRIFGRLVTENGVIWKVLYTFPKNTIGHIHRVFTHPNRNTVIVCTGDTNNQSGIWEFRNNFSERIPLIQGTQKARCCVAFPVKNGIVYATDTPLEDNEIVHLDLTTYPYKRNSLLKIAGPVIYGCQIKDSFVFATSVEGNSKLKGWRYRLTYQRGAGVIDWKSHIYYGNLKNDFREINSARKDILPMCLFGFGTFLFPSGDLDEIVCSGQSLMQVDGKTITINLK